METDFMIINPQAKRFLQKFFPSIKEKEWNDWHWQMANRITTAEQLEGWLKLSPDEAAVICREDGKLPFSVTPYFAHLLDCVNSDSPLRRTVVPVKAETIRSKVENADPVAEGQHSPFPSIVHRYPDRVLFLVNGHCSTYCRYCNRSRIVGRRENRLASRHSWEEGLSYIRLHKEIRDVLISGGDPLLLADEQLEWLLSRLIEIPHVEFLRIGSKVPVVLPQRITGKLTEMLRRYHPLWMSIHFTHPAELTAEVEEACRRIADAGIPMGSHTVLLKGINDSAATIKQLYHKLLRLRVKPYYLFQCDAITGSAHFRTPLDKGLEILDHLQGYTTGYAVPLFVIDIPGQGGKSPLFPGRIIREEGEYLLVKNYRGEEYLFPHSR